MPAIPPGRASDVFVAFLRLGLTAFGGPIAHIAYLRREFVQRRGWLDDTQFAQLLAVCQCLPGPTSSQMGFAIGLLRARWRGALMAFAGFTLPSALLMLGFAFVAPALGNETGAALLHGLKLVAVVVVAHGLYGMTRQLVPDLPRAAIAIGALALVLFTGQTWMQLAAIGAGGLLGLWWCRHVPAPSAARFAVPHGRRGAMICLALCLAGLAIAFAWPSSTTPTATGLAAALYRSGALVFGGGHVVLPLLQQAVVDPGWLDADTFLAGYGAAQAVPGPMFSLAAFVGAEVPTGLSAPLSVAVALLALFLPGFLLLLAALPLWQDFADRRWAPGVLAGINAAVVGLLAAALYDPLLREGVRGPVDAAIAVVGIAMLASGRIAALWVVLWCVAASIGLQLLG